MGMKGQLKTTWALTVFFLIVALFVLTGEAMAVTAPTVGSFAYDVYDIFVNDILKGAVGFVAGAAALAYGGVETVRGNYLMGIPAVLGGAIVLKADTITESLGMII